LTGTKFEVLQYQDQYKLPEHGQQQLWIGLGMAAVGLLPFFFAYRAVKTAKRENQRIARLTKQNHRVPALAIRISEGRERRAGSMSTIYHVHAKFEHQGKLFEARSEATTQDPSASVTVDQVRILLDRANPLQSIIAADTLSAPKSITRRN
jgi:ribosomal protein L39E